MNNSNTLLPTLDGISNLVLDNIETNSLIVDTNAHINGDLTVSGTSILNNVSASKLNQAVLNYDISNNLSLGDTATFQNRGGTNNVVMGYKAMGSGLNSGSYNFAIGYNTLYSNTTGRNNTALGSISLYANTSGWNNVGIGFNTCGLNTTGNSNVGIGFGAVYSQTGNENVGIGYNALSTLYSASSNTAIGSFAGGIYAQDGDFNTYIGAYSDTDGLASYTQSTAIGANSQITASNQIKLGTVSETVYIEGNLTANFGNIGSLQTGFIYCDNFSSIGNLNVINFVSGIQAESGIDTSSIICSGNIIANIVSSNTFLTGEGKIYDDTINMNIEGFGLAPNRSIKLWDNVKIDGTLDVSGQINIANNCKIDGTLDVSGQINIANTHCLWWDSVGSSTYIQGYNDNAIYYCSKNVHRFNINGNQIGYFDSSGLTIVNSYIKSQSDLRLQPVGDLFLNLFKTSNNVYLNYNCSGSNVIVSTGNVGIGMTSPAYALDVSGSGRFSGSLYLTNGLHQYANYNFIGPTDNILYSDASFVIIRNAKASGPNYVYLQTNNGGHSAYLDNNGAFFVETLYAIGKISSGNGFTNIYTTLPTFTNQQIGYSRIDTAGPTTLSATSTWYSLNSVSLPVGVWSFNWKGFASSFTGGIFIRTAVSLFSTSYAEGTLLCNSYIVSGASGSGLINGSGTCSLTATTTVNLIALTSSPSPIIDLVELQYTRIG